MKLGDIVHYQEKVWRVRDYDDSYVRLATLWDGQTGLLEIPHDLDATDPTCKVLGHPATEWPYAIVRDNTRGRFMVGLTRVVRGRKVPLTLLSEWLPNDPARPGGPVYLNPELGIKPAETLLVSWSNGPDTPLQIPVHFGTMSQKVARQTRKKLPPPTSYDRLLNDRFDEDDG